MERLTKINENGQAEFILERFLDMYEHEVAEHIAHYENLEEQGYIPPCKIGDEFYRIITPYRQEPQIAKYQVVSLRFYKSKKWQVYLQLNGTNLCGWFNLKGLFLTKEEAEAKKELTK